VLQVQLDQQVSKVLKAHRVHKALQVQLDLLALRVLQAQLDQLVSKVLKDLKVLKV
jgi:hypothetical protein